ncbi:MAG: tRNA lysidine(34) synthetase TilS [Ilumatobacter sp.]|nr:tRNA lysidine(34) synthetase TilS [Ilumatobacter sp.]
MDTEPPPAGDRLDAFVTALLSRCTLPPAGEAVVCAFSGGPDSAALVALAARAGCVVTAVHVDHGLRPDSAHDAELARRIADQLGVTFRCEQADVADGPNLEARARDARRLLLGDDALTGHTADDQAETTLLALLRGSGAAGLAGMQPDVRKPLLRLRRAETHRLCDLLELEVADDPTNDDPRFRRNRVRNELLPLTADIADRDVVPLIARAADLLRDDDGYLDDLAATLDPTDARQLAVAPLPLSRRALRRWLTNDGYPPDSAAIERVLAVARGDATGCEVGGGLTVRRSGQRLRLCSTPPTSG